MENKRIGYQRPIYYQDGITKVTDPFYVVRCSCGHAGWSCTYKTECSKCGSKTIQCFTANEEKKHI